MRRIDVFNGDADGLCALRQLRLAEPADSQLVTGLKRDIALLDRVRAGPGDAVTVLDVSLDRNREALERLLADGASVRYFDHHYAGDLPVHPELETHLDQHERTCTSMLVDQYVGGRFRLWAVVGAFGDRLDETAGALGGALGLGEDRLDVLRELGRGLNYNAYGEMESDLLVHPEKLYRLLAEHEDPFRFSAECEVFPRLRSTRMEDLVRAREIVPRWSRDGAALRVLPEEVWARRVHGELAYELIAARADRAQAVAAPLSDGSYVVSVRVPAGASLSAGEFCRAFPSGGGRLTAGGIDRLPRERLQDLQGRFADAYG